MAGRHRRRGLPISGQGEETVIYGLLADQLALMGC